MAVSDDIIGGKELAGFAARLHFFYNRLTRCKKDAPMLVREWVGSTQGQGWQYQYYADTLCPFLWHYHPEFELTYTRNASGMRYVGSDAARFGSPDLVLVAPNQPHTWQAEPRADGGLQEVQVVFFTLDWLQGLASHGLPELQTLCRWLEQVRSGVVFSAGLATELAAAFADLHALRGLARLHCLLGILERLQHDPQARYLSGSPCAGGGDRRLQLALDYLQQHYTRAITLADLARVAAASPATLKRLFARQMHTTFSALLAELRIGHACNLLLTSEHSIPWIASASGFPSLSQFYRSFGAQKQQSPAAYRRAHRLNPPA
ncbi:helix-turn-helix domain-containing protein [Chitinilyticum litopenaei]|uniref:helix-turn-helix domain-containing protein n=1 Tax=Chitinilyticum litopenaei TaxID=1121276 RepID=UPI00041A33A7|nr:AraC family transcriptional regulator [Chitinilyticum litopenaei]